MTDFLTTVENDVKAVVNFAEAETQTALTFIWNAAKPIFTTFEPVVVQAIMTELSTFLTGASADVKAGDPAYIATTFLATLRDTGATLLADAESLGEDLLTTLAGLTKVAAAKA